MTTTPAGQATAPAETAIGTLAELPPCVFVLQRHIDHTGISGTGPVAEGVVWSDGTVSLRWRGKLSAITYWRDGIPAVEAVHGHGGTTQVRYLSATPPPPTPTEQAAARAEAEARDPAPPP